MTLLREQPRETDGREQFERSGFLAARNPDRVAEEVLGLALGAASGFQL
jgi:hypothetical protein